MYISRINYQPKVIKSTTNSNVNFHANYNATKAILAKTSKQQGLVSGMTKRLSNIGHQIKMIGLAIIMAFVGVSCQTGNTHRTDTSGRYDWDKIDKLKTKEELVAYFEENMSPLDEYEQALAACYDASEKELDAFKNMDKATAYELTRSGWDEAWDLAYASALSIDADKETSRSWLYSYGLTKEDTLGCDWSKVSSNAEAVLKIHQEYLDALDKIEELQEQGWADIYNEKYMNAVLYGNGEELFDILYPSPSMKAEAVLSERMFEKAVKNIYK